VKTAAIADSPLASRLIIFSRCMMTTQTIALDANYPRPFPPPWAVAWGDDHYGLWAEAEFGGAEAMIVQRLRWIAPGDFLMGSPRAEQGAQAREHPQHQVFISNGYWLADTACTQALWLAVMGNNPSHFQESIDLQHPVEQVSWLDVQQFLRKLSLPGAQASLPTEAEWEYACRAGTTTPFSFGENISTAQVNFDGNHPYADAKKGEYRKCTVAVRALPANPWGLYQMHGNLWEWCADTRREYTLVAQSDPGLEEALTPVENEDLRAVRGGCWVDFALSARSAYRSQFVPDGRLDRLGFRFVLRSSRLASRG
jgi:sulfatase modifying factor 1